MENIKLFEVGGSIRDELMGKQSKDRDFCAVSPDGWSGLISWSENNMDKIFMVSDEFFTIRGAINKQPIDIVMCRKDGHSSDGRRPDHVEPGSIIDDLGRRDFTVNSIAREVCSNTLITLDADNFIDPFEGRVDILNSEIRCVGNTKKRFKEDGLRILRCLRFIVTKDLSPVLDLQFALNSIRWWDWMDETVSQERIREELSKMMKHDTAKSIKAINKWLPDEASELLFSKVWLKPTLEKRR